MSFTKVYCFLLLFIFSSLAIAQAQEDRDLLIQKELDCVDGHLHQDTGISWNDVCDVPESNFQEHMQIVNQQMDQVQGIAPTHSQPPQNISTDSQALTQPVWSFALEPEVSYIRYHEPTFMKESGVMSGVNGVFIYHPEEGNALNSDITDVYRIEGMFTYGKVDYHGGIENSDGSSSPESFNGIDDYMVEIRDLAGKDFYFNNQSTRLTPFMGAGYRSLYDSLYENKPFGYNRHIQYLYAPIGIDVMDKIGNGWSIEAIAEYDIFIRGFVQSDLKAVGLGDLSNIQSSGYGLRGSIKLIKYGDHFNLYLEPFIRYWSIHASRVDSSDPFLYQGQEYFVNGYEPANNSLEIGGKLGLEF